MFFGGFTRHLNGGAVRCGTTARHAVIGIVGALAAACVLAADYKVGDRVEGWNYGWYKGSVTQIGSGSYAGYYLVHHDAWSQDAYYSGKNLRPLKDAGKPAKENVKASNTDNRPVGGAGEARTSNGSAEPAGEYLCGVMISGHFTTVQRIVLKSGRYTTNRGSGGAYAYDIKQGLVDFKGGALGDLVGRPEPENKGVMRLTQRKDLGESLYTQKQRSQICSPQKI